MVRIIGGRWKRSLLPVPDSPGLRPTPDRVRETLFNWLGPDLRGLDCLDLFAGTGALGFEAASRDAARVVMIEQHTRNADALRAAALRLGAAQVEVIRTEALGWIERTGAASTRAASFDVSMVDVGMVDVSSIDVSLVDATRAGAPSGHASGGFDLVFLDPPFGQGLVERVLPGLAPLLAPGARIYIESDAPFEPAAMPLAVLRRSRAGQVHYHLLEWTGP